MLLSQVLEPVVVEIAPEPDGPQAQGDCAIMGNLLWIGHAIH
jgi:hypothetical protein